MNEVSILINDESLSTAAPLKPIKVEKIAEEIVVCNVQSDSMFKIPIVVNSIEVEAIIDTAAQVTIISDKLF